jgi:dynein heavy chain
MLSLGQGQGPIAERMIEDAIDKGSWVILQNCHLSPSWMPKLEAIVEKFDLERCSAQFRLWLTSYPSDRFPVAILQNGIKMTLQPPKGLRANMLATYAMIDEDFFTNSNKPSQLRKLHFALAHFHASLQERIKYGALGFNIPYSFTESDYLISQTQVKMFLDEFDEIPWEALRYTAGETNYGGRVTDAHDRTCVNAMLKLLYNPGVLRDDYKFSESGTYFAPPEGSIEDHRTFLRNLPQVEAPECFGLHENANITFATTETYALFGSMLSLLPKGGGGGDGLSKDSIIQGLAENMLERLPVKDDFYSFGLPWLVHDVAEIYPTDYKESMNTVLTQELLRYNGVITNVRATLQQLVKAVQGIVVMSTDLELMATSFVNGSVPALWSARCYPSLKPLGAFYDDFIRRLAFLQTWINDGAPAVFWLPGFYFTQSFLTGTLQNFARKYTMAIDTLGWSFEVKREHRDTLTEHAADGCYVDGLFFDGAGWDTQNSVLAEQDPKVLFVPVPVIHFKPSESKNIVLSDTDYRCPVYKTSERKGTLSTTGHSTNFVLDIIIPSPVHADHWILRGVACLTSLDF